LGAEMATSVAGAVWVQKNPDFEEQGIGSEVLFKIKQIIIIYKN
jgi:hypothetical protein